LALGVMPASRREARKRIALDRLLAHAPLHRVLARSVEAGVIADVELPAPVLDLGCGDGTFAYAAFDGPLAAGIDTDGRMLRWARRLEAHRSLARASGAALPFRDGAFRSVVCNSTLEHIPEADAVLREARRVLEPGGTFIVTVPSEHFFPYHLGSSAARALRLEPLARLYDRWMRFAARVRHWGPPGVWLERLQGAGFYADDWRYYFTAGSMRAMDAAQYISVPSFLTKWLLGRWVLWQGKGRVLPLARWIGPFADEGSGEDGAFLYFRCSASGNLAYNESSSLS
jgi:SAM-dependent methyltransferase